GVTRSLTPPIPGVTLVDTPRRVVLAGLRIGCVPHTPSAEIWAEQAREVTGGGVDLLACHQSFHGQQVPGFTFRVGRPAETVGAEHLPSVRWIASGHLHPRQRVRVGGAEVVCPGSAVRTSFREGPQAKGYACGRSEAR
nr:hypothetical protein [Deltaproteobacteria bacterium]